jgi:type IV pilus assembly protein PilQ
VKHLQGSSLFFGVATTIVMAAQPVWAKTTTQITGVQLNATDGGMNVVLKTSNGDRPQIFTTRRGNAVVSDIINTQLRLSEGNSFRQDNPAPGIASVVINQLDANSIRIIVTGTGGPPSGQPAVRKPQEITLGFNTNGAAASNGQGETPAASNPPTSSQAQAPAPTQTQNGRPQNGRPPVLVPNPEININGKPAPAAGPAQPVTPAPPFLPRAVAPPVGDIAVSNIDVSPSTIDLGTQERVPRLVLRDAPVREVLSLLARAAGLNLAYTTAGATGRPGQPAAPPPGLPGAGNEGPTISLDIENEPVQDVFNYVLRLSGLEANRTGRTIFVGPKLPNSTRDNVVRSLRLNQVTVDVALNFLVGLGAESAVSRERLVTSVNAVPVTAPGGAGAQTAITQTQTVTEQRLELQRVDFQDSQPILRGLQALGDARTNSVTLIGNPRQVEFAIAQLTQLDIRRRQVAVNVKVVDVDLANTDFANASFSFGIVDSFFQFRGSDDAAAGGGIVNLNRRPSDPDNPGSPLPRRFISRLQSQIATGNGKILTDPVLVVQEGQTANVRLTREVIGNIKREISSREGGLVVETITVEKVGAGLTLNVKVDRIDDNGFVALSVAPVVTIPYDTITANVGSGGEQGITLLNERSLQSGVIRMRDGQTLVLSGIIQDSDRTEVRKVPILGDIPILGALFRRTNRVNERREVIVLLTPQIMDDSERSSSGYNYTPSPDARQMLERRGLQIPKK